MKRKWVSLLAAAVAVTLLAAGAEEVSFFEGHANGVVSGFDNTDPAMFRARPESSKLYNEVWFHEMQFADEGLIVIVNLQLHNLGLSSGYCDAFMTVSDPSSPELFGEVSSIDPDEVKIDPQGFGITAGPHRIALAGDTYRIQWKGKSVQADFTYKIKMGSFQQGSGKVVYKKSGDWALYNFPIPWADVSGTLTYNGKTLNLKGQGSMNHDRQVLSPTRYMSDWRALWLYTPDATVSVVRASAPDLAGQWSARLMVGEPGRVLFSSHDYTFEDLDPQPVEGSKVPCPRRYRLEAAAGDDWLKGEVKVTRIQEKKNILADYPPLFRKMASLVVSETWSYRFWCDFKFEFKQGDQTRMIEGTGTGNYVNSVKEQ